MNRSLSSRAGPLFGAFLVVVAATAALTPAAPGVTAADPTPVPSVSPDPTPFPSVSPDPTPAQSPDPSSDPAPLPSPDPTIAPSPDPSPVPSPDPSPVPSADPSPAPSTDPSPPPSVVATGLRVAHVWVDSMDPASGRLTAGTIDRPVTGLERFRVYQVRFQVVNDGDASATLRPMLRTGLATSIQRSDVPTSAGIEGAPFFVSVGPRDPAVPRTDAIRTDDLRLATSSDPAASAAEGVLARAINPAGTFVLGPHTFTEVAFDVRATSDAAWSTTYGLDLDLGGALVGSPVSASVTLRSKPAIVLTPGQQDGVTAGDVVVRYPLQAPSPLKAAAMEAAATASTDSVVAPLTMLLGPASFTSPHMDFSLESDSCGTCHRAHTAQGTQLLQQSNPSANTCFTCHDGSGALSDVKGQYTDPAVPANDPTTSSWYAHPATTPSDHGSDRENEFGGRYDRHSECADCHQPHLADGSAPTATTGGWTASGTIGGASGVSVVNGAAGTSPTYTWNPSSTLEYQLCFKCHSGFTKLPAQDPAHPSRWELDKGVELNPANVSYHPVEAAGKNSTTAMAASLTGTSPYKLWDFGTDSTIRCVDCHGDSRSATPATPPDAAAQLAPHAVSNRGILMAPYRDRTLKPQGEAYKAADFALCYQCHAESPMVDTSGDPNGSTNFQYHGVHLNLLFFYGVGSTDIDVDGAGQGNATCSECHFRTHGTTYAVDDQPAAPGLVNFAPDVQPYRGVLRYTKTATGGSCTLVCHSVSHNGWSY